MIVFLGFKRPTPPPPSGSGRLHIFLSSRHIGRETQQQLRDQDAGRPIPTSRSTALTYDSSAKHPGGFRVRVLGENRIAEWVGVTKNRDIATKRAKQVDVKALHHMACLRVANNLVCFILDFPYTGFVSVRVCLG